MQSSLAFFCSSVNLETRAGKNANLPRLFPSLPLFLADAYVVLSTNGVSARMIPTDKYYAIKSGRFVAENEPENYARFHDAIMIMPFLGPQVMSFQAFFDNGTTVRCSYRIESSLLQ